MIPQTEIWCDSFSLLQSIVLQLSPVSPSIDTANTKQQQIQTCRQYYSKHVLKQRYQTNNSDETVNTT